MLKLNQNPDFKRIETIKTESHYYDLDAYMEKKELRSTQALDQSIENVLMTPPLTRIFNLGFGCPLIDLLFENFNSSVDQLFDQAMETIEFWVPIRINRSKCDLQKDPANHTLTFMINYDSNDGMIRDHTFARRIRH